MSSETTAAYLQSDLLYFALEPDFKRLVDEWDCFCPCRQQSAVRARSSEHIDDTPACTNLATSSPEPRAHSTTLGLPVLDLIDLCTVRRRKFHPRPVLTGRTPFFH